MVSITTDYKSFFHKALAKSGGNLFLYSAAWAAGTIGNMFDESGINYTGYLEADKRLSGQIYNGKRIFHISELDPNETNYIFMANHTEVDILLIEKSINNAAVLVSPNIRNLNYCLSICRNRRLNKKEITIFSNNCIAGVLYKSLDCETMSPTINMIIRPDDYIKFCSDTKKYIEADLSLLRYEYRPTKELYPIAALNDISIYFVHYDSFEKAKDDWEKRKARIQWDNMYYIFDDYHFPLNKQNLTVFDRLPLDNKIAFVKRALHGYYHNVCYLSARSGFMENIIFETWFDFVSWINGEN